MGFQVTAGLEISPGNLSRAACLPMFTGLQETRLEISGGLQRCKSSWPKYFCVNLHISEGFMGRQEEIGVNDVFYILQCVRIWQQLSRMLHFLIPHKLDNWGKMTTASSESTGHDGGFVWTSAPAPLRLFTFSSTKGSNEWINNNSGQHSCHFLPPLHLLSAIVHPGRQFAVWQQRRPRTSGSFLRIDDEREMLINMFYTNLSTRVPCFLREGYQIFFFFLTIQQWDNVHWIFSTF